MSKTIDDFLATLPQERQKRIRKMADELVIDIQLSKIRQELDLSQQELALSMGVSQAAISSCEKIGKDLKISTIKHYIESMGGKLRLDVELPTGKHIGFNL